MSPTSKIAAVLQKPLTNSEAVGLLSVWSLVGCLWFIRTFLTIYMPAGDVDIHGYLLGRDFVNIWAGAQMLAQGRTGLLADVAAYQSELRLLFGDKFPLHNFSYPPHIFALILPFGLMPYFPSLALWVLTGTAALLFAVKAQKFFRLNWVAAALVAFSPASLANIVSGQNGAFMAALFLGGFYLCETAPVLAGVLFGLLTVKPHLGILVIPVLLMRRNWKCMASATVTALLLIGLSVAIWGVAPWQDYYTKTMPFQTNLLKNGSGFFLNMMPGPYADALVALKLPKIAALAYAALAALFAFAAALLAVKRQGMTPRTVLVLALATLVILPYSFNYDMVAVAGALVVFLGSGARMTIGLHLLLGLLWALPLAVIELKGLAFPCSSLIMLAALWAILPPAASAQGQARA